MGWLLPYDWLLGAVLWIVELLALTLPCCAVLCCLLCVLSVCAVFARFLQPEVLGEVLEMLRGSAAVHGGAGGGAGSSIGLQVEQISRVMRQWAQQNGLV